MSSWPDFEATFPSGPPRPGSPDRPPGTADIAANWDPSAAPQPDPDCSLFPSRKFRGARTGDPHALGARAWASRGRSRARGSRRGGRVHPGRPGLWSGKPGSPLSNSGGLRANSFRSRTSRTRSRGSPRTGSGSGDPAHEGEECFATGGGARLPGAWACSPPGEGQRRGAHLLSPSPRSPRRRSSRSPRAGPVCRRGPGRSGRSWISSGWKAAASQSEPGPDPPRCGQRGRVRRLNGTPTRDPPLVAPHTRASSAPQTPRGAPSTQTPRAHPTAGLACSRASCPPRGAQGTPLPTRRSAAKVLLGFRAGGRTLESMDYSDLTRAAWGERSVAVEEVNPRTRNRAVHGQLGGRGHGNWFPPPPRFSRLCSVGW